MKIKVSAVSYLNSKPLIYGLENGNASNDFELSLDIPSVCASKLIQNKVDIGLIPVAVIPELKEHYILSDFCIGAVGEVQSVLLVSKVPLNKIRKILLDYQSRTSIQLTKVLAKYFWKIEPEWRDTKEGYEDLIDQETAAVIIGDRAFSYRNNYEYIYDLSKEWYDFTQLPFVFACWVANKKLSAKTLQQFNERISYGMDHKKVVIDEWQKKTGDTIDVENYLNNAISYELNNEKRKGLKLFFSYLEKLNKHNISSEVFAKNI